MPGDTTGVKDSERQQLLKEWSLMVYSAFRYIIKSVRNEIYAV